MELTVAGWIQWPRISSVSTLRMPWNSPWPAGKTQLIAWPEAFARIRCPAISASHSPSSRVSVSGPRSVGPKLRVASQIPTRSCAGPADSAVPAHCRTTAVSRNIGGFPSLLRILIVRFQPDSTSVRSLTALWPVLQVLRKRFCRVVRTSFRERRPAGSGSSCAQGWPEHDPADVRREQTKVCLGVRVNPGVERRWSTRRR